MLVTNLKRMPTKQSPSIRNRLWRSELALPIIVGCIARLAMFPFAHLTHPKLLEYGDIARLLVRGKGYSYLWSQYIGHDFILPSAYMPPGQVMIQALGLLLFGDTLIGHAFIFLEEVAIGTVFVYAMWRILSILFSDKRIVHFGTWLSAIYPSFVFAVSSFGVLTAVLTVSALFFLALLEFTSLLREHRPTRWPAIAVGLLAGTLTLFRSEAYLLVFLVIVICFWPYRRTPRIARSLSIVCASFLLVVAPWITRNAITLHKFIPASTTGGFNFWRGHNQDATGSSWNANGGPIWTTDSMWNEFEPLGTADSNIEFKQDRYHFRMAMDWIAPHPAIEIERTFKKAVLLWGIDWYSKDERNPAYILLYSVTIVSLIVGAWRIHREQLQRDPKMRDAMNLITLWCFFYTAIAMAFFSVPRLQIMVFAFSFPIIIYGADCLLQKFRTTLRPSPLAA
jgi:hypothetical protein